MSIVRGVIEADGAVTRCRVVKSVPHMDAEVVAALQSRRYTPILFQGSPVTVDYVFTTKLTSPKSEPAAPSSPPPR